MDKRIFLKVKIKSLVAETRIIQSMEARHSFWASQMEVHRHGVIRDEMRATLIAYGFVRGRAYEEIEPNALTQPDWDRVAKMVSRYGISYDPNTESYSEFTAKRGEQVNRYEAFVAGAQAAIDSHRWGVPVAA